MKNVKNFWKAAGLICLCLCLCLSIAACDNGGETEPTQGPTKGKATYTIEVTTAGGLSLSGVQAYVYTDSTQEELESIVTLNAAGRGTFEATISSDYVAVLSGVPEGYNVEAQYKVSIYTQITLTASVITDAEKPSDKVYQVGDVMYDFSITAANGTEYKLSELLQEKDAVVLNFWYLNCQPCKLEFPFLELAYERYKSTVEVLAINCEDGDNASIQSFAQNNGLTFPVAIGDKGYWYPAGYTASPTTIVIDRYGVVVYKHQGYFDRVAPFAALFRTVSGEDYQQVLINDVESIITDADYLPDGTEANPFQQGGGHNFSVQIPANGKIYYKLYRLDGTAMRIENPNVYMIVDGETYRPVDGVLEVSVTCPDTYTPASVVFCNDGNEALNIDVCFAFEAGNINNPLILSLGDNLVYIKNLGGMGLYHNFYASTSGVLTITVQEITEGAIPDITLFNSRTQQYITECVRNPETGLYSISIQVNAGDDVQVVIGASADEGASLTSATITAVASIQEDDGSGIIDGKTPYSVTVLDQDGKPMENVTIRVTIGSTVSTLTTDENGVAAVRLAANAYLLELVTPVGYVANDTAFLWSPKLNALTVTVVENINYTVTLKDNTGKPVQGVLTCVYADAAKQELLYAITTDATGTIRFSGTIHTNFYLEFANAPAEMHLEATYTIQQADTLIVDKDPEATFGLGDTIHEFVFGTANGECTTLYDLLNGKDMLVLTFYTGALDETVKANLQYACETYGKDAIVVALSTELPSAEQGELGFLLASCEEDLIRALQIQQYPTTVVIDREGKICLIHSDIFSDMDTVDAVFTFFTDDAYIHTTFEDLSNLLNKAGESENGSEA